MPANIKQNPVSEELWSWIHHRIKTKGFNWITLAEKHGCHPSTIKTAKDYAYPRIEKIIAEAIGMTPQALFPNRYTSDGKPIGRNYPRDRRLTRKKTICNGKDEKENCHEDTKKP